MDQENRVVVLIDMDCFYCQVEEKLNPELKGKPIAVVQYNPWKGGGIIAVNYVARAMGVNRHMRGDEAKEKCPEIILPSVPCSRGKADISKYRDAGKEVAKVLQRYTPLLERASIDEAYLDITAPVHERLKTLNINDVNEDLLPNTFALGYGSLSEFIADVHNIRSDSIEFDYEHAKQLLVGATIVSEIRAAVYQDTGYRCSAGIAHNKILAKLVCGMNKPDKQTVLPKHSINILYSTLSVKKVKHLGGKFGYSVCEILKIQNMSQLQAFTLKELQARFDEKNGTWLYNIARGIDLEPVQARFNPKSIGCCKQLRGKSALTDLDSLKKWLTDLGDEIEDRLEKDALESNRTPKQMVVSFSTSLPDGRDVSSSRSYNFSVDDDLCGELFTNKAMGLVMETTEGLKFQGDERNRRLKAPIKFLGISVGKFEDNTENKKTKKILDYFGAGSSKETIIKSKDNEKPVDDALQTNKKKKNVDGKEFLLRKFFQVSDSKQNVGKVSETHAKEATNEVVVESTLEKQESFFAKLLNGPSIKLVENPSLQETATDKKEEVEHPSTPVIDCGENSNDTEYSSSTIDKEINKSIALFEENPEDIARVSNMRKLLNSTLNVDTEEDKNDKSEKSCNDMHGISNPNNEEPIELRNNKVDFKSDYVAKSENFGQKETFECPDCKKNIAVVELDTHADYHLALTLRDEERQQVRLERNEKNNLKCAIPSAETKKGKPAPETLPNKGELSSIASFLVKIDNTIETETCPECHKRVPKEKLPEHLDFHEARKLSRVLNNRTCTFAPDNRVKRKRTSVSPLKKPKVACKSIDSFFR